MGTDELIKAAAGAAVGALTKAAAEPALTAGRRVWDWLKQRLASKDAAAITRVEANPTRRSAETQVIVMLQDLLEADPALAGELRRMLDEGGGVQAINQTANVPGDGNTTVQVAGRDNTTFTGR